MSDETEAKNNIPWPVVIMLSMLFGVIGLGLLLSPSSEQDKLWWVNLLGTTNHGVLLNPPVEVSAEDILSTNDQPWEALQNNTFKLVVLNSGVCDTRCQEMLRSVRQVHVRLNRDYSDVERGYLPVNSDRESAEELLQELPDYALLRAGGSELLEGLSQTNIPAIGEGPILLMIDPAKLAMMAYTAEHTGSEILEDLEHLLELAR